MDISQALSSSENRLKRHMDSNLQYTRVSQKAKGFFFISRSVGW
jgi:hypothetical protein